MSYPTLFLPSGLPKFIATNHGFTETSRYAFVQMGRGRGRKRGKYTGEQRTTDVSLFLTRSQSFLFYDWYENALKAGSLGFTALVASDESDGGLWWSAKWFKPYTAVPIRALDEVCWEIKGQLILDGEGTPTRPTSPGLEVEYYAQLLGESVVLNDINPFLVEYFANLTVSGINSIEVEYLAELKGANAIPYFLLLESGAGFFLLEDGVSKILLEA